VKKLLPAIPQRNPFSIGAVISASIYISYENKVIAHQSHEKHTKYTRETHENAPKNIFDDRNRFFATTFSPVCVIFCQTVFHPRLWKGPADGFLPVSMTR